MSYPQSARAYTVVPKTKTFDDLILRDVPVSAPQASEVLVKIRAVSLQFRDLMVIRGTFPPPLAPDLTPCSDMAGDIVALGEDVKGWKIGDRVSANFFLDRLNDEYSQDIMYSSMGAPTSGVLREYRTFPAHALVEIPAHLSYEEVSAFPCAGVTAYNALFGGTKSLKAGDTVLIQGTGGVSIFALQFAVASGATTIVTSSSDAKLQIATKLGAKHVINYTTHPNWDEEVLRLTGGTGVDRVVEVGGNATLAKSLAAVRTGGNIDLIGQLGGIDDVSAVDIVTSTIWKEVNIRGMSIGSIAQFKQLIRLLIANPETTRPIIDRVFAFEEARQALEYLEGQKHVGKVIVRVG